ncbi:hypothetical protein GLOIN_2v1472586 [Rhizophagus irregularis DAOM 181602=DAOM 197198]|nr:hypothetical protein RhiirB3_433447 [Rhizophagus irregularis]GET62125.1 hypothetical protein GLOIN_2v1472586 [Rhizophagus irregularis DAOM 181602=DAOM 197198]
MASDNCHNSFPVSFLYLLNKLKLLSFQFCIRSKDPDKDKDILIQLYNCGFFQPTPKNHTKQFWNAYQDALDSNICGIDGSNYSITEACYYAVQEFHEEYPDGLKRTTFYGYLQVRLLAET